VAYEATRSLLVEDKKQSVSFGISSLQATPNLLSLHKFKLRMGYKAVPICRTFHVHWLLAPLVEPGVMSRLWDWMAAARPGSAMLSKLAGMSRLMSGRATDALKWAQAAVDAAEE
jgi:hypothetical protein